MQETAKLADHDMGLLDRLVASFGVSEAEGVLSEKVGGKVNINNAGAAYDGLYDAYKLKIVENVLQYSIEAFSLIALETDYRISDGTITPDEMQELSQKVERLQRSYPDVSERYTIDPIGVGSYGRDRHQKIEMLVNVDTHADPDEAFSLLLEFNSSTRNLDLTFGKPHDDALGMMADKKIDYVLEQMDIDKDTLFNFLEHADSGKGSVEFIDALESVLYNANDEFGGIDITPALMMTELKVQAEQSKAFATDLTSDNGVQSVEVSTGTKAGPGI